MFKGEFAVREKGVVKWFNAAKGYGLIRRSTGEDVFVHYSSIQGKGYRTLDEAETVEFECEQGPKGLNAVNVMRNASLLAEVALRALGCAKPFSI